MLVVGVGIGLVMQVLVLVVQNDARPQEMGVATSTATFFRSVGGSFGVAIFGTIFATRLADQIKHLPPASARRLGAGVHLTPLQAKHLPPAVHADFLHAFSHALHGVFLWGWRWRSCRSRSRGCSVRFHFARRSSSRLSSAPSRRPPPRLS